jgi:hypothetical protein
VPLAPVAHMPQMEAFAPGSTGNQRPSAFRAWGEREKINYFFNYPKFSNKEEEYFVYF